MKKSGEEGTELKYEVGFSRLSDKTPYRGPATIKIDGKIFYYFEHGNKELGIKMKKVLGELEKKSIFTDILKQIIKDSKEEGNFTITLTKYIPFK